jgi:HEAT repeats
MVSALPLILLALALTWAVTFAAVVAGRLRADRHPTRLRGVRRVTVATPAGRRLAVATDRRRRRRWSRIEALRLLAQTDPLVPSECRALAAALGDRNDDVRLAAVTAVSARADELAAELLAGALAQRWTGRARVATELERLPDRHVGPLLEKLLADRRPDVRFWALQVIGRRQASLPPTVVNDLLEDPSPDVRAALAEALPQIAEHPASLLLRLLGDDAWYVRVHAARSLGEAHVTPAAPAIAELLHDESWWVRDAAEKALVALGSAGVRQALRLLDDEDPFARDSAAEVLQETGYLDRCVAEAAAGNRRSSALVAKVRKATGGSVVDASIARLAAPDERDDEPAPEGADRGLVKAS